MSSGKKYDNGKPPITLIPSEYIEGTAAVFAFGAKKYGAHNYRQGLAPSRCIDAAMRHLLAIARGELIDPESGLPHIYHASCSLAMADYNMRNYPHLNDIYELTKGANNVRPIVRPIVIPKDAPSNSAGFANLQPPEQLSLFEGRCWLDGSSTPERTCPYPNCGVCNPPSGSDPVA